MTLLSSEINESTKTLSLFTPERIDASNADKIEADLHECLVKGGFDHAILDCKNLKYVSSAGLRDILLFKKKFPDFCLINVCNDVYDVLDMTGFASIITVKKALRVVSIEGLKLIGSGYMGNVYRLDEDKIIKHFLRVDNVSAIENERALAKASFILGVPTAIAYETVEIKEGGYGAIFELVTSSTLCDLYIAHPENYEEYTKKYLGLLKEILCIEVTESSVLPNKNDQPKEWLKVIKENDVFNSEEYSRIESLFKTIPYGRTFIHGDFHIKNMMVQGNELLLIDMETAGYGNVIFELGAMFNAYIGYPLNDPNNIPTFFGITDEVGKKLYKDVLEMIFFEKSDVEKAKMNDRIALFSFVWLIYKEIVYNPNENRLKNDAIGEVKRLLKTVDTLNITI